jgi:drug/metabolite transporter (DMT)-like permease
VVDSSRSSSDERSLAAAGRSRAWLTHAALVGVQAAFAAAAVEGKLALGPVGAGGEGIEPLALAMARMTGAALFFQVFMRGAGRLRPLPWVDHARIGALSVLGIVLNQTLYLVGLRITTAFAAALLGATIPVFTAAVAIVLRVERADARTWIGLALAFAGVLWLTGIGRIDVGALVIALNCLSYSLYIVLSKPVIQRVGAATLVTWLFTWGAVILAPLGGVALVSGATHWSARGWLLVAFFVAVPTIFAYFANAWALARTSPTVVTIYIYLQPLLAALLQWVQLGVPVTSRAVVATAFILGGVAVVTMRRSMRAKI